MAGAHDDFLFFELLEEVYAEGVVPQEPKVNGFGGVRRAWHCCFLVFVTPALVLR